MEAATDWRAAYLDLVARMEDVARRERKAADDYLDMYRRNQAERIPGTVNLSSHVAHDRTAGQIDCLVAYARGRMGCGLPGTSGEVA